MKVVFPKPDSPATYCVCLAHEDSDLILVVALRTMIVNAAPRFATILCLEIYVQSLKYVRRQESWVELTFDLGAF